MRDGASNGAKEETARKREVVATVQKMVFHEVGILCGGAASLFAEDLLCILVQQNPETENPCFSVPYSLLKIF
jgi:hypothetical protein